MVLNELSLQTPAPDIPTARTWMSILISTLREATATGVKRVLRTSEEINSLELAPDYPISRWRNDKNVSREEKQFFRSLTSKAPLWTDVAEEFKDDFDLSEVWYENEAAQGLGFARAIDALTISFQSEKKWKPSHLNIAVKRLTENDELIDEILEIKHASCLIHIQEHTEWIKYRIRTTIKDGNDLWNRRKELFPNLIFCESLKEQLTSLNSQHPLLQAIQNRFFELEEYSKNWIKGSFDSKKIKNFSPESQATLEKPKCKQERTFKCPDGEERLFSWHAKLNFSGWRIYFFPQQPGTIIIGYVGPHLSTIRYKQ